tara:strand:+ start:765 stop:1103 length:339 start_codon:yes stop_codon:yes gene_type:complete
MATKHGNRVYIQVLLEPFRGQLFLDEAARQEAKPSALIRHLVYNYLAEHVNEETYCDAVIKDKQKWQEAVNARLEGRAETRRSKITSDAQTQASQCDEQPASTEEIDASSDE